LFLLNQTYVVAAPEAEDESLLLTVCAGRVDGDEWCLLVKYSRNLQNNLKSLQN